MFLEDMSLFIARHTPTHLNIDIFVLYILNQHSQNCSFSMIYDFMMLAKQFYSLSKPIDWKSYYSINCVVEYCIIMIYASDLN